MNIKKIFGADFGKVGDKYGLRLTFNGIGVRGQDGQIICFNKDKKELTTVPDDLSIGDFPFYALPTNDIKVGDTILHAGAVKVITDVDDSGFLAVDVKQQREEVILVSKNLFGFKNVAKVISLFPEGTFGGDGDGKPAFNPLILALMDDDGDDSDMKMFAIASMMGNGSGSGSGSGNVFGDLGSNPMMAMLLFKDMF